MVTRIAALTAVLISCSTAHAQDWAFDARKIALGGMRSGNIGADVIDDQQRDRAIVLPFGLIQVFADRQVFDPGSNQFDPIRAVEYAASPLHYQIGRSNSGRGSSNAFATAIRSGTLNRDLNVYQGFVPADQLSTQGLASPKWGGTITLHRSPNGTSHGVFIGAGPYLSMMTADAFDPRLTSLLASNAPVVLPNTQLSVTDTSQAQLALAVTGGYRGRFATPGIGTGTVGNGIYLAVNYNYLRGFRYENANLALRLQTDNNGLLTATSTTPPLTILRQAATSGQGFAIDVGVGAVIDRLTVGFGANGLGNRITWTGVQQSIYALNNLLSGNGNFVETPPVAITDARVELPVDYRANVSYRTRPFWVVAEAGHGFGGTSFHGGVEKRWDRIELRGGGRYTLQQWNPTGGVGFNLSRRLSLDLAAFGTSANIERTRRLALAASIRIHQSSATTQLQASLPGI